MRSVLSACLSSTDGRLFKQKRKGYSREHVSICPDPHLEKKVDVFRHHPAPYLLSLQVPASCSSLSLSSLPRVNLQRQARTI